GRERQRVAAARARGNARGRAAIALALGDEGEEAQDGAGREGQALVDVEPEGPAGVTEIEADGAPVVAVHRQLRHREAAAGAGDGHRSGERRAALRTEPAGTVQARVTARARHRGSDGRSR